MPAWERALIELELGVVEWSEDVHPKAVMMKGICDGYYEPSMVDEARERFTESRLP